MKQAPAGSFAVWSSCLLQREGLPFVDAVVWGFRGNWFLYLPDLLGGDLLCALVQAAEFTEKSMPRGWVGFFSLPGLFSMCNLTRRQPANVVFRATPNSAQNHEPHCLHQWWGAGEDFIQWCIPSAVDDMDHLAKQLPGQSQRQPHWMGTPYFVHCRCHWAGQTANYLPREHFPIDSNNDSKGRTGFSKEQTDTKRARTINLHTHKKIIYIYLYICGEKCVFTKPSSLSY